MAGGEHAVATVDPASLPRGFVVTSSGRVSGVTEPGEFSESYPFSISDRVALDEALVRFACLQARFAVFIGDLGADTAASARQILGRVPTPNDAVLCWRCPQPARIEVVYGSALQGRGAESAAPLGVAAAASAFQDGNLIDGLVSAIRVLSAGISRP